MIQPTFEKWMEMTRKMQAPFQAIAELNMKTLQNLSYLTPEELMQLKQPEDFLEKQIHMIVENGHKALDHMQESFNIFEKAIEALLQEKAKNGPVKEKR